MDDPATRIWYPTQGMLRQSVQGCRIGLDGDEGSERGLQESHLKQSCGKSEDVGEDGDFRYAFQLH